MTGDTRCFVHSDLARALIVAKRLGFTILPQELPMSIVSFLAEQFGSDPDLLSFPAFNYDFGRTRVFDVRNDEVQVGSLPEWVRNNGELKRCNTPFFSVLSNKPSQLFGDEAINPFGATSHFQTLYDENGLIVFLGASIKHMTFLHYVEEVSGGPLYRYEKLFSGTVISTDGHRSACEVSMHVRPRDTHFQYDFGKIEHDLRQANILHAEPAGENLLWGDARLICDFLVEQMHSDPFYLLAAETRDVFVGATDGGQRRVRIEDFEND